MPNPARSGRTSACEDPHSHPPIHRAGVGPDGSAIVTPIVYKVTWHEYHVEQAAAPPPHGVGRASRCLSRRDPDAQAHVKTRIHTHRSTAQGWGPTVPLVTRIVYRVMNRWNHVYLGIRKLARHHVVVGQPLVLHEMHATSLDTRSLFL